MPLSATNKSKIQTLLNSAEESINEAMALIESLEDDELAAEDVETAYQDLDVASENVVTSRTFFKRYK
jgi:hypothetical protein